MTEQIELGIYPTLSKDYVLERVSQEEIFSRFMQIEISEILRCLDGNQIKSPLRFDKDPTMGFKYNGLRLRAKDFNGHFWGDCFDLIAYLYRLSTNKGDFAKILDIIAKEFKIHKYEQHSINPNSSCIANIGILLANAKNYKEKSEFKTIRIKKRAFNSQDRNFWSKIFFNDKELVKREIYPCKYIWLNDELIYNHTTSSTYDIAYAYYEGKTADGHDKIQIYFPYRESKRFITNFSGLLGLRNLKEADNLVITKSRKDVEALRFVNNNRLSIETVSPTSENYLLSKDEYHYLFNKYNNIYTLMDFDFTGRTLSYKMNKIYNTTPLFFGNGKRGFKVNHSVKDFSEYLQRNGIDKTFNLVESTFNYMQQKNEQRSNIKNIRG